jgi:hypothetical protein
MNIKSYFQGSKLPVTLIVLGVGVNVVDNVIAGSTGSTTGGPIFGQNAPLGGIDRAIGFDIMGVHVSPAGEVALIGLLLWLWMKFGR